MSENSSIIGSYSYQSDDSEYLLEETLVEICKNGNENEFNSFLERNTTVDINYNNNKPFIISCANGSLEIAKILYYKNPLMISRNCIKKAFRKAIINGKLNIIKWLYRQIGNCRIDEDNYYIVEKCCEYGYIDILKWINNKTNCNIPNEVLRDLLDMCCKNEENRGEIFKYILKMLDYRVYKKNGLMTVAIINKKLNLAKILYNNVENFNLHYKNNKMLRISCITNQIETVKWLLSLNVWFNTKVDNNVIFRKCAEKGFTEILKMIYEYNKENYIYDINIQISCLNLSLNSIKYDTFDFIIKIIKENFDKQANLVRHTIDFELLDIFMESCRKGIMRVFKTIIESELINPHENKDEPFITACENGNESIARYIYYQIGNVKIRGKNDRAFLNCCENRYYKIARWLQTLYPNYYISRGEPTIVNDYSFMEKATNNEECCVCFDTNIYVLNRRNEEEMVEKYKLPCSDLHIICKNCIYKVNDKCPNCRKMFF
jgi:hypothetical protein